MSFLGYSSLPKSKRLDPVNENLITDDAEKTEHHARTDIYETGAEADIEASEFGSPAPEQVLVRTSSRWVWLCLINIGVLALLVFRMWSTKRAATLPTSLHDEVLTMDGKSFPSGQLSWSQNFTPLPCGKSPDEALARGCHFDMIATAWLPPKCIDQELVVEFMASHPWQYFRNQNGTEPLPTDADSLGSQTAGLIWTTHRWHWAHCLYMWKKLNRALVHGWMTDGETIKQGHTDHCTKTILSRKEPDIVGSIVEIIYPPC